MTHDMDQLDISEEQLEALDAVAGKVRGQSLEDRATRSALRRELAEHDPLRALGSMVGTRVATRGALVLRGVPNDTDAELLALFQTLAVPTKVGNGDGVIHTVEANSHAEATDISNTDHEFPLHTDSTFMRDPHHFVALACIDREANSGGLSTVVHVDVVAAALMDAFGPDTLHALQEPVFAFLLRDPFYGVGVQLAPIISSRDGIRTMRYRRDIVEDLTSRHSARFSDRHRAAMRALDDTLVAAAGRDAFALEPGDMLVLDNRRVMHGRSRIAPGATRVLRRMKGFALVGPEFELLF